MALSIAAPRLSRAQLDGALADLDAVEVQLPTFQLEAEIAAAHDAFLVVDRGFHRMLAEVAANSRLIAILESLWAQIAVFQRAGAFRPDWIASAIAHHRAIIAPLQRGDADAAASALADHIATVKQLVLDGLIDAEPAHPLRRRQVVGGR